MSDNKQDQTPEAPPSVDEIDLSAVANFDAAAKKDKGLEEVVAKKASSKRRKDGRFNFSEAELVPLPSKGNLYKEVTDDEDILSGFIRLYPMTTKEEEILSTQRHLRTGASTRLILQNCIDSAIDAKDILVFDSNFLLFYLRKISYGDEYEFELTSTEDSLRRKFKHKINISELRFEELDDDVKEPIVVKLPRSKYTVETILPRMYHIEEIYKMNSRREKRTDSDDKRLVDNLLVTTVRVLDENKEEVPSKYWEEFFEALPGMDIAELREKTKFDTGVDELKGIICPYTDREMDLTIPMGPEFFRF
jgi:hypothetical protein